MTRPNPIELAFNPDTMTVRDMKAAVQCLRGIFMDFDTCHAVMAQDDASAEQMEAACNNLWLAILQVRDRYTVE